MTTTYDPFARPEFLQFTGRSRAIERLQKYYDSEQYKGMPDWWTGTRPGDRQATRVPLRERAPCVIYDLPRAAVCQVVSFLFGDARFPQFRVSEVTSEESLSGIALTEDDTRAIEDWLTKFSERSNLKPAIRQIAERGIAMKTAVVVMSIDRGQFCFESPRAQDCFAEFIDGKPRNGVKRLLWTYEYEAEVSNEEGKPTAKRFRFRREWDQQNIYVFEPVPVETGKPTVWGAPEVTAHKFTFCPVLWIPNLPELAAGQMDGVGLFEGQESELDALNFAYSQRHRGVYFWGVPQPWETGVGDGDGPEASGRSAMSPSPPGYGSGQAPHGEVEQARKIAPDEIWRFENPEVKLGLLETTGTAFKIATEHINDIRSRLLEEMQVVITSMADTVSRTNGGEMSAKFLQLAHAPLLALVGELRHFWWPLGLRAILEMALRMCVELKGEGILVPGSDKIAKLLAPSKVTIDGAEVWYPPEITPTWGRYFEPSSEEVSSSVTAATTALEAHIITRETATRHIADDFGVDDVHLEIEQVDGEIEEAQAMFEAANGAEGDTGSEGESSVPPSAAKVKPTKTKPGATPKSKSPKGGTKTKPSKGTKEPEMGTEESGTK